MHSVVHFCAIVFVLLIVVQNFATADHNDITTEVPVANTQANLANETELIDTTRLIMEYESTISANNESTASNGNSSPSGITESHNSNNSTALEASSTEPTVSTENKTMTSEEIQRLLLPPAKIEASILHLNTTEEVHEKIIK